MDEDVKRLLETMRQENATARAENAAAHADLRRQFDVLAENVRRTVAELNARLEESSRRRIDIASAPTTHPAMSAPRSSQWATSLRTRNESVAI